jgi:hypothetical protein
MKVLIQLAFEEGDAPGSFDLNFVDGSSVTLSHEAAARHVPIEAFTLADGEESTDD